MLETTFFVLSFTLLISFLILGIFFITLLLYFLYTIVFPFLPLLQAYIEKEKRREVITEGENEPEILDGMGSGIFKPLTDGEGDEWLRN